MGCTCSSRGDNHREYRWKNVLEIGHFIKLRKRWEDNIKMDE